MILDSYLDKAKQIAQDKGVTVQEIANLEARK